VEYPPLAGVGGGMNSDNTNNFGYQKELQPFANTLRKNMTKAEACLWKFVLRAGNMKGFIFRRQRPVLKYIADFMCKELMLVIEVDGITHQQEETFEKDKIKQKDLEYAGFKVIRFNDEEVLNDIENVRREIEFNVEEIQGRKEDSTP